MQAPIAFPVRANRTRRRRRHASIRRTPSSGPRTTTVVGADARDGCSGSLLATGALRTGSRTAHGCGSAPASDRLPPPRTFARYQPQRASTRCARRGVCMLRSGEGRAGPGSPVRIHDRPPWRSGSGEAGASPALTRNCERRTTRRKPGCPPPPAGDATPVCPQWCRPVSYRQADTVPSRSGAHGGDVMRAVHAIVIARAPEPTTEV
jgi:hypothetical protein